MLDELRRVTNRIRQRRYPQSKVIFLAGSLVRGEGTSTSDLDLVVVFERIPSAFRESFICGQWPVEAFVHDPQTLEYFFREVDRPTGFPSLPSMVVEGVEVPEASDFSDAMKELANEILDAGPPEWSSTDVRNSRYGITDLIEDLKDPRSIPEMHATATLLYPALVNHYFRSRRAWSAKGKTALRNLHAVDPNLATKFSESFECVFSNSSTKEVIELATEILEPSGGLLFDGHKLEAPKSWRIG